jgi:dTMP kinase
VSSEHRGLFLVFEGIEGAGKSTQLRQVAAGLERAGVPHLAVREPGATPVGERIRDVVLDPGLDPLPETELLLMLSARAEFVRRVVLPALERGEIVLADRYELSTFAYQGEARGLGLERVRALNRFATGGLRPDGTLLFLLEPELARRRVDAGRADRMERAGEAFHAAVDRAYRRLAEEEPNVIEVSADGPPDSVASRVWSLLEERWPERFPPSGRSAAETFEFGTGLRAEPEPDMSDQAEDA